jgi:hypothetical protein
MVLRHLITTTQYVDSANKPLSISGTPIIETGAAGGSAVVTSQAGLMGLGTISGYNSTGSYFAFTLPTWLLLLLAFAPLYLRLWRARQPSGDARRR